jgi:hypothetical protein
MIGTTPLKAVQLIKETRRKGASNWEFLAWPWEAGEGRSRGLTFAEYLQRLLPGDEFVITASDAGTVNVSVKRTAGPLPPSAEK